MKETLAKLLPIVLRELMWLFAALILAVLLSTGLRQLLALNGPIHDPLLRELPADAGFHLRVLLFGLCLLGVYVARVTVAAIDSLVGS